MPDPSYHRGTSRQDYKTPEDFLEAVKALLHIKKFDVDLAASDCHVCESYYTEEQDSLNIDWSELEGWLWLNPPFDNIKPWVEKAKRESQWGAQIAMLVPSSVGSNWWRDHVAGDAYIFHLNGRLKFVGHELHYPKDCSLLIYHPAGFWGTETWNWREE